MLSYVQLYMYHSTCDKGFEVLSKGVWLSVTATVTSKPTLSLTSPHISTVTAIHYNWYSNNRRVFPFGCAVYTGVTPLHPSLIGEKDFLPLPPF